MTHLRQLVQNTLDTAGRVISRHQTDSGVMCMGIVNSKFHHGHVVARFHLGSTPMEGTV